VLPTDCAECAATVEAPVSLTERGGSYSFVVEVDCPHCDFSRNLERPLIRR